MTRTLWAILLSIAILSGTRLAAQEEVSLRQAFRDLSNDGVVMDLSAHPDDEDGATLAYYRMKFGVKTTSVLFTRGEGGQNEKGPELYQELGALRSHETYAAGAILGTDVYFLNFFDFGFSKSATEAIRIWGGQTEVLRRLVYIIRLLKPDIIFTNHNTIDGHGHHQAVAMTALAAFDAAADPHMFPEQLRERGLSLWQPRKLYFRNLGRLQQAAVDVVNRVGEADPVRGTSYLDIAYRALREHRTQGLDRGVRTSDPNGIRPYTLVRATSQFERDTSSFFGGYDLWLDPAAAPLVRLRQRLLRWHPAMPRDSLLREASAMLAQIEQMRTQAMTPLAERILSGWRGKIERVVTAACGLSIELTLRDSVLTPRQSTEGLLHLRTAVCGISDVQPAFDLPDGWTLRTAQREGRQGEHWTHFSVAVGGMPDLTLPRAVAQYRHLVPPRTLSVRMKFRLDGFIVSGWATASYDIAPPRVLEALPRRIHLDPRNVPKSITLQWRISNYEPRPVQGKVRMKLPPGWRSSPVDYRVRGGERAEGTVLVYPSRSVPEGERTLSLLDGTTADSVTVSAFAAAVVPGIRLGIVASYDTTIEGAAHDLGLGHELITDSSLQQGDLTRFTSIVVDIRAYLVREALRRANQRLLDFVRNGGNLIVMYQRLEEWDSSYAPYRFRITPRRVVDEHAPVVHLVPGHPLLNMPNRIRPEDWDGWKQERGLYFPGAVPSAYVRLVATGDADEEPLTTGYLAARYGKGSYIYTSLVWYRQLKELNAGAFRSFANMLSYHAFRDHVQ